MNTPKGFAYTSSDTAETEREVSPPPRPVLHVFWDVGGTVRATLRDEGVSPEKTKQQLLN